LLNDTFLPFDKTPWLSIHFKEVFIKNAQKSKGMGVRPTHFTPLNIHAIFVNFGTNHNQA